MLVLHALLGTAWILATDRLAGTPWASVQTAKGLAFIAVSNVVLAFLLWRHLARVERLQTRLDASTQQLLEERERRARSLELDVQERTAELRAAGQELERLTWCVTHDLGGPTRTIRSRAELLARELGRAPEPAKRHLDALLAACGRQEALIGDLLERLKLGRHPCQVDEVDLEHELAEALADLPVGPGLVLRSERLPKVAGRSVLVRSLLWNLLSNAVRHGGASATRPVKLDVERRGPMVELSLRDQGPVAGAEVPGPERAGGGSGLGLQSASACAERLGGSLLVERASPTQGTWLRVRLPAAEASPAGEALPPREPAAPSLADPSGRDASTP